MFYDAEPPKMPLLFLSCSSVGIRNIRYTMDLNGKCTAYDVLADINYFPANGKVITTEEWKPRYLGVSDDFTRKMTIHDIRGMEDQFGLDRNGFKFVKLPSKHRSTEDDETIKTQWYPEVAEVIKEL